MAKQLRWKVLSEEDISPSPWYPLYKHKVRLPNGKVVDDFYVSHLGDVAMVVAVTKNRELILVKQYKHGVRDEVIELPAGRIPEGKKPIEVAENELLQETGIRAGNLKELGVLYDAPSKDGTNVYGFLTDDVEITTDQTLDDTEDIDVLKIPIDKVDEMISRNEIKGADSVGFIMIAKLKFPTVFI